jgi:hypothetical protein
MGALGTLVDYKADGASSPVALLRERLSVGAATAVPG